MYYKIDVRTNLCPPVSALLGTASSGVALDHIYLALRGQARGAVGQLARENCVA